MKVRGEKHPSAIFTVDEILKIRQMHRDGLGYVLIGKAILPDRIVNPRTIQDIVRRHTWKHIPDEEIQISNENKLDELDLVYSYEYDADFEARMFDQGDWQA